MRFESFSVFVYMDGHGIYIWAAYGVTLAILTANVVWPLMARRRFVRAEMSLSNALVTAKENEDPKRESRS